MGRLILALCLLPSVALAQSVPDKRAAIGKLLDALRTAPNEQVASALEGKITQSWLEAGTPAVTLLMSRGLREANANAPDDAVADFSDAIVLDPTLAEAWHQRAVARFKSGDMAGAVHDLEETLKLEPRHFGAWRTLERIAEGREDWKAAYSAWQHVLDIDPRTRDGEDRLKDLKRKAFGDNA
jgi:tetratricopeptide (TPR) repeat protein